MDSGKGREVLKNSVLSKVIFPRYCDKLGLKTALHKVTAKQFQANIRGKNKSSSAMCLLSTHIDPKWQCLHKIIHYKCSVTSKEDIKKRKKEGGRRVG